jgi:hypothetical protein
MLVIVLVLPLLSAAAPATRPAGTLEDLRDRYAGRKNELAKELRSLAPGPSITDETVTAAINLEQLKSAAADIERNASEAKEAYEAAVKTLNAGGDFPAVLAEIERHADVKALKDMLAKLEQAGEKNKASIIRRKLDDVVADVRAARTATIIEALREQQRATASQVGKLDDKVRIATADLAAARERQSRRLTIRAQLDLLDTILRDLDQAIAASARD